MTEEGSAQQHSILQLQSAHDLWLHQLQCGVRGDTLQHCSIHHQPLITGHCSDISYGGGIVLDSGMTSHCTAACLLYAAAENGPILQIS